jgi:hypothetical protein
VAGLARVLVRWQEPWRSPSRLSERTTSPSAMASGAPDRLLAQILSATCPCRERRESAETTDGHGQCPHKPPDLQLHSHGLRRPSAAQQRRTMSRSQRTMVSGGDQQPQPPGAALWVSRRAGCGRCQVRPVQVRAVRLLWLRDSELVALDQDLGGLPRLLTPRDSRSHAASRVIRRNTNHRHTIGGHHGPNAGRATLLVRAADGILGSHN